MSRSRSGAEVAGAFYPAMQYLCSAVYSDIITAGPKCTYARAHHPSMNTKIELPPQRGCICLGGKMRRSKEQDVFTRVDQLS